MNHPSTHTLFKNEFFTDSNVIVKIVITDFYLFRAYVLWTLIIELWTRADYLSLICVQVCVAHLFLTQSNRDMRYLYSFISILILTITIINDCWLLFNKFLSKKLYI